MDMEIIAWLVDDETPHARVVLGKRWPPGGGNYLVALVRMIDAQNAIHAAVAAERERCAKLVAAMDNDYLRTSPCRKALERAAKAIRRA